MLYNRTEKNMLYVSCYRTCHNLTCSVLFCYITCSVLLYNMHHVLLYNVCHVLLYNMHHVLLYNVCLLHNGTEHVI